MRYASPIYKQSWGGEHMSAVVRKEDAHRLVDQLPPDATWDDLMHEIYVREAIDKGLADSNADRTKDVGAIRRKFGLPE
jgi:hypothetical protein